MIWQKNVLYEDENTGIAYRCQASFQILARLVSVTLCSLPREWQKSQSTLRWERPSSESVTPLSQQRKGLNRGQFTMIAAAISEEIGRLLPQAGGARRKHVQLAVMVLLTGRRRTVSSKALFVHVV